MTYLIALSTRGTLDKSNSNGDISLKLDDEEAMLCVG